MQGLIFLVIAIAVVLWVSGLVLFFRLRGYLNREEDGGRDVFARLSEISRDKSHEAHSDLWRSVYLYGAFLACIILLKLVSGR